MKIGQHVKFEIHDRLIKDVIVGTGVITCKVYGKLWFIQPEPQKRLSGDTLMIHEDFIESI